MKGRLRQTMEKARWGGRKGAYRVQFRNFDYLVDAPLDQFWKVADVVPEHRIARILLESKAVYESSRTQLLSLPVRRVEVLSEEVLSDRR